MGCPNPACVHVSGFSSRFRFSSTRVSIGSFDGTVTVMDSVPVITCRTWICIQLAVHQPNHGSCIFFHRRPLRHMYRRSVTMSCQLSRSVRWASRLWQHHQAGGVTVQAVHDVHGAACPSVARIHSRWYRRYVPFAGQCWRTATLHLLYHDDIGILVYNLHQFMVELFTSLLTADLYFHTRFQRKIVLCSDNAVHIYNAFAQQWFHSSAAGVSILAARNSMSSIGSSPCSPYIVCGLLL